jgi:hypothetical protein
MVWDIMDTRVWEYLWSSGFNAKPINQFIDLSTIHTYHRYKGLSSPPGGQGIDKISLIPNPIYTNHSIEAYAGYKGLADIKV